MRRTLSPTQYGTAFHTALHNTIQGLKRQFPAAYSDLFSELSISSDGRYSTDEDGPSYAEGGTIRADVLQRVSAEVTCVYDAKTGKTELTAKRVAQIAQFVWAKSPGATFYIVQLMFPGPGS